MIINQKHMGALFCIVAVLYGTMIRAEDLLPWEEKAPFKSGVIHYKTIIPDKMKKQWSAQKTLYVRNYGRERVLIDDMALSADKEGKPNSFRSVMITTENSVTSISLESVEGRVVKKTGKKWAASSKNYERLYAKLSSQEKKLFRDHVKERGALMLGHLVVPDKGKGKKILGYDCERVGSGWYLRGVSEPLEGSDWLFSFVAEKIDTDADIPDAVFQAPEGVTVKIDSKTEGDAKKRAQVMIERMLRSELDPGAAVVEDLSDFFSGH